MGAALRSETRAESMGNGHVQTHASQEGLDALEDIKVLRMPDVKALHVELVKKIVRLQMCLHGSGGLLLGG